MKLIMAGKALSVTKSGEHAVIMEKMPLKKMLSQIVTLKEMTVRKWRGGECSA